MSEKMALILTDTKLPGWGEQLMYATRLKCFIEGEEIDKVYWSGHACIQELVEKIFLLKKIEDLPEGLVPVFKANEMVEKYIGDNDFEFLEDFSGEEEKFKHRYQKTGSTKIVGINFSSYTANQQDPEPNCEKSIPIEQWLPLFDAFQNEDCVFVSLQYGHNYTKTKKDICFLKDYLGDRFVVDPTINFDGDQMEPAKQMLAMDTVVSISNSAAHLAGFMGRPGVVMRMDRGTIQGHWKIVDDEDKSLYYPTLKIITKTNGNKYDWSKEMRQAIKHVKAIFNSSC